MITDEQFYQALFYQRKKDIKNMIAEAENIPPCYLALAYAVLGEKEKAKEALRKITPMNCDQRTHRLAWAEAEMAICYLQRDFPKAAERAKAIILEFPDAIFANYTLARIALYERNLTAALVYYEKLLNAHPKNDKVLLDSAETLFLLRRIKEAIQLIKRARSSLRQKLLYAIFLLFKNPGIVLFLWLATSLASVLTGFNIKVYLSVAISLLIGAIFLRVDPLLFGSLLFVDIIITIAWFTTLLVW